MNDTGGVVTNFGGRYRLIRRLGAGGMGEVWLAYDTALYDRPVAIKMMHSRMLADAEDVARFQREMKLASRMQHPSIMTVFTTGEHEGVPFMVMEYLEGRDLSKLPSGQRPDTAARVGRDTCLALAYAHALGVVHRDIKPGNVFICDSGLIKVTDFGIARAVTGTKLSATGTLIGTFPYMAPEQWLGQPPAFSNDIWAVGCMLYEMLSGRLPRSYASATEYAAAAARQEPVSPLRAPGVPSGLANAVMAMLQADPGRRPTAAQCVRLLSESPLLPGSLQAEPSTAAGPAVPAAAVRVTTASAALTPVTPVAAVPPWPASAPGAPSLTDAQSYAQTRPPGAAAPPVRPGPAAPSRIALDRTAPGGSAPVTAAPARKRRWIPAVITVAVLVIGAGVYKTVTSLGPLPWIPDTGTLYVAVTGSGTSSHSGSIIPIDLATGQVENPVSINGYLEDIAVGPHGGTAYVTDSTACSSCSATPGRDVITLNILRVSLADGSVSRPLSSQVDNQGGAWAYLEATPGAGSAAAVLGSKLTPVNLTSGLLGRATQVKAATTAPYALSPDGSQLLAVINKGDDLAVIDPATGSVVREIKDGRQIGAVAFAPDGSSAYVYDADNLLSVNARTGKINWTMSTAPWGVSSSGSGIMQLVVTPNGQTAYLTAGGDTNDAVIPVNLRTRQAGREVAMPDVVQSLALSPDGKVVYAGLWDNDGIVPVDVATGKAGRRVAFSGYVSSMAVAP
jgi:hypothetical protein